MNAKTYDLMGSVDALETQLAASLATAVNLVSDDGADRTKGGARTT